VNADLHGMLRDGRWVQPTSAAGVLGIGAAAFLLSYDALHSLALASGVRPGLARIWPGVLDGFIVIATLTVVAAKRTRQPTWYPWALVALFSAASVAFNILHALDRYLTAARWVRPLVFAMPPIALVLATHLLLQQGAWQRLHTQATSGSDPAGAAPVTARQQDPDDNAGPNRSAAPTDAATRQRALQFITEAQAAGRKLTGAQLGRAIGRSDRYGRLLLREFRTTSTEGNGDEPPQMTAQESLLHAALAYAARGFRVLPLHHPVQMPSRWQPEKVGCSCGDSSCGPVGKHPRTRNGLHDATTDPAQLARWWQRWPQANIGLVTGELADVLDIDGPAGQAALRR
jgi:hypothetical protein